MMVMKICVHCIASHELHRTQWQRNRKLFRRQYDRDMGRDVVAVAVARRGNEMHAETFSNVNYVHAQTMHVYVRGAWMHTIA